MGTYLTKPDYSLLNKKKTEFAASTKLYNPYNLNRRTMKVSHVVLIDRIESIVSHRELTLFDVVCFVRLIVSVVRKKCKVFLSLQFNSIEKAIFLNKIVKKNNRKSKRNNVSKLRVSRVFDLFNLATIHFSS